MRKVEMKTFEQQKPRDAVQALLTGFRCRCPNCGEGKLFRAFLKVVDHCPKCGEDYSHQRADDAPAYFTILITGHVVVPLALLVETEFAPSYWIHWAIWLPMTLGMALGLLQPIKGAIVGYQWAHRMHGFDPTAPDDFEQAKFEQVKPTLLPRR